MEHNNDLSSKQCIYGRTFCTWRTKTVILLMRRTSSYTLDTELRFAGDVEHNPITSGFCYPGRAALRGPFINQMIYSCLMKDWWRYTD